MIRQNKFPMKVQKLFMTVFSRFRPQKSTLYPEISLIERENSSDEIIFESLCIYLEHKYLKEQFFNRVVVCDESGREKYALFITERSRSHQISRFCIFFWKVFAPTAGISLIDTENSSKKFFASVRNYLEYKHQKKQFKVSSKSDCIFWQHKIINF